LKAAVLAGRRIHYVHALHRQYGPCVRVSPTEVAVADPAGFKRIHALNSGFAKSSWYTDLVIMEREGVFSMSGGKPHADRRRLLSRPFSKSHLRQAWEPTVRQYIRLAVENLLEEARSSPDGRVDVLKWWTFMASDVSAHLMFGESFHTIENGCVSEYIRVLQNALKGGGIGAELPWVRAVCRHIPLQIFKDTFNGNDFLMLYGKAAVEKMKAGDGGGNIFANMMRAAEKGEQLDEKDVQVEATNLIVASTDTTAVTLTYLVWAVLSNPGLQCELVAEVGSLHPDFSDTELEALPLLNSIIEETLRLYGAAPGGLPRSVPMGGVEMGGYSFPEGTTLTTQSFSFHRDPELFPDPYKYFNEINNQIGLPC
jgi:cytochrome P450